MKGSLLPLKRLFVALAARFALDVYELSDGGYARCERSARSGDD
jgi:hypothetical protein